MENNAENEQKASKIKKKKLIGDGNFYECSTNEYLRE